MSFFIYVVLFFIALYTLSGTFIRVYKQVKMLKPVPGPPKDYIIIGHLSYALLGPSAMILRLFLEQSKIFGGIVVLWFFHLPFVFIAEAHFTEIFFTSRGTRPKSKMYKYLQTWLGQGLLTSEGKKWQKHRKLITPTFHFSILNSFCEKFAEVSEVLIEKLRKQPEGMLIDVFEIMGLTALDSLCETAMSAKVNALKNSRLDYLHSTELSSVIIMGRIFKPLHWNQLIFSMMSIGRKLKKNLNLIFRFNEKMIEDRRNSKKVSHEEEIIKTNSDEPSGKKLIFLDTLLEAAESKSTPLTAKDVKDEVATFMFEGHETTASALSFIVYLLGLHPEIQTKCLEELSGIFQNSNRRPTTDDLQRMQYLEQVIKESLRLFPSVPMISRETTQEVQLGETEPSHPVFSIDN